MLEILYQDEDVIAVSKPAGMLVIPGRDPAERSLRHQVDEHLAARGDRAFVVHRIDRGSSGVVLFARNAAAHRALNLAFERREVEKEYLAVVEGDLEGEGCIQIPLHTARRGRTRPAMPGEPGQESRTTWQAIERFGSHTSIRVIPQTGRHHQIRVHLKAIGHPLAFDPIYGRKVPLAARDLEGNAAASPSRILLDRTPLHASRVRVRHPSGSGVIVVEADIPQDMRQLLTFFRNRTRS